MQALSKILTNGLLILGISFGLIVSPFAASYIEWVKIQAEQGDARAQSVLASSYSLGRDGLRQNYSKAFYWHKKAADQGDAISQYLLGDAYADGEGIRQDYSKAVYWLKKAADQNNAAAQYSLGTMYYFGKGVRRNKAQANKFFKKSCDNGIQSSCKTYQKLDEESH
ncbi:tetratricopeptide repeat protein [Psychrobacter sp. T6-5]|uniref:tetratricopeptide repeat protein n=1 Tax=Psychrobacter sp. T6-5 TaxID=3457451 RepID=UPI003FCEE75D